MEVQESENKLMSQKQIDDDDPTQKPSKSQEFQDCNFFKNSAWNLAGNEL